MAQASADWLAIGRRIMNSTTRDIIHVGMVAFDEMELFDFARSEVLPPASRENLVDFHAVFVVKTVAQQRRMLHTARVWV